MPWFLHTHFATSWSIHTYVCQCLMEGYWASASRRELKKNQMSFYQNKCIQKKLIFQAGFSKLDKIWDGMGSEFKCIGYFHNSWINKSGICLLHKVNASNSWLYCEMWLCYITLVLNVTQNILSQVIFVLFFQIDSSSSPCTLSCLQLIKRRSASLWWPFFFFSNSWSRGSFLSLTPLRCSRDLLLELERLWLLPI